MNPSREGPELKASMIFCEDCDNLLYPASDADRNLQYRCGCCGKLASDVREHTVVYALNTKSSSASNTKEDKLLAQFAMDPTAQRDPAKECPKCRAHDVACFVNPLAQPTEDMSLYFACAYCQYVWKGETAVQRDPYA